LRGIVFSSSTIFRLPNGAKLSPDVAWIKLERWEALTQEEREKFPPLTPHFIIRPVRKINLVSKNGRREF
jgi:Uma2 family endonuclease